MKAAAGMAAFAANFRSGGVTFPDRNSTPVAREGIYSAATKIARFYRNGEYRNDLILFPAIH